MKNKHINFACALIIVVLVLLTVGTKVQAGESSGIQSTGFITELEGQRDPKCFSTASRFENMLTGISLTDEARFTKEQNQKKLVQYLWTESSKIAKKKKASEINKKTMRSVIKKIIAYKIKKNGDVEVQFPSGEKSLILNVRIKQYASIAYSLRAILSFEQDRLLFGTSKLLPMNRDALALMKEVLDVSAMAVLDKASQSARIENQNMVSALNWQRFFNSLIYHPIPEYMDTSKLLNSDKTYALMIDMIDGKIKSYIKYNSVNNQEVDEMFIQLISNSFAKAELSEVKQETVIDEFQSSLYDFALNSLHQAQYAAKQQKKNIIDSSHALYVSKEILPFTVDDQETINVFPNLPAESLKLAPYELDALRDFAFHWKVIKRIYQDPESVIEMEMDPFAAEILAESISQYGLLILKRAGDIARRDEKAIDENVIQQSVQEILQTVKLHWDSDTVRNPDDKIISAAHHYKPNDQGKFFVDATGESGIGFEHKLSSWFSKWINISDEFGFDKIVMNSGGLAAGDINNDGFVDVLFVGGNGNKLFLNERGIKFIDVTDESVLNYRRSEKSFGEPRQPIIADFNNDGWQDILITYVDDDHRLYQGIDGIKFKDVTEQAGLLGTGFIGGPAAVFDFDRDGLLDIYIGYYGKSLHPDKRSNFAAWYERGDSVPTLNLDNKNATPNVLYRNEGGFKFSRISDSGTENQGWTTALSHTDINNDGMQDIIVANDYGKNAVYINEGLGKFSEVSDKIGIDKTYHSMNVGLADLNWDGFPDIYFSNINSMLKNARYRFPGAGTVMDATPSNLASMLYNETNTLYLSQKEGERLKGFILSSKIKKGLDDIGWAWDAEFFDFDNDGDDDLYVLNGYNPYAQRLNIRMATHDRNKQGEILKQYPELDENRDYNIFFVNQGGELVNFSDQSGAKLKGYSSSAVYLDYDHDGDLDMILNNTNDSAVVYKNITQNKNNWIKIKLVGNPELKTNLDAIGARIIAITSSGKYVWREIHGGSGYMSMEPKILHFGLGGDEEINALIIWPNGDKQEKRGLKANKVHVIVHGKN